MLDERKLSILYAIINSYILCAEPVGSRTISKQYDLGVSSATIRNEMSDLEGLGYLVKAHSSSGRIPSDKAYRHYVNYLLNELFMEKALEKTEISILLDKDFDAIESLIMNSAKVLSDITKYTALAIVSRQTDIVLKKLQLVDLTPVTLVLLIVYDNEDVKHHTMYLDEPIKSSSINILNNYINSKLVGKKLSEVPDKIDELISKGEGEYSKYLLYLKNIFVSQIDEMNQTQIIYDGVANIFNYPEYKDIDKAREFVDFLEAREGLTDAIMDDDKEGLKISIGEENKLELLTELSIVSSIYGLSDNIHGRIGIIGPKRMDYSAVIMTILSLTEALESLSNRE